MPVYSRTQLRQRVGFDFLHDMDAQSNTGSLGAGVGSVYVQSSTLINPAASGNGLYEGVWIYMNAQQYIVASLNVGSGALVSAQPALAALPLGSAFEVHMAISPRGKHFALDETIRRVRQRQEVGIEATTGRVRYDLDAAASPNRIEDVLDVYWLENPGVTTAQKRQRVVGWQAVRTASGHELRIEPAVPSGTALIVDAAIEVSLGAADDATVMLPDDRWIAVGAAAQCLWQMERRTGPEGVVYGRARAEMEAEFTRLTAQFGAHGWAQGKTPDGDDGPPVAPSPATHEPF